MEAVKKYLETIPNNEDDNVYDFYGRGVNNKKEIREYFKSWFRKIYNDDTRGTIEIRGKKWYQVAGFRRAFYIHMVYVEPCEGLFAFFLADSDNDAIHQCGDVYKSYDELLDGMTEFYAKLWHILN